MIDGEMPPQKPDPAKGLATQRVELGAGWWRAGKLHQTAEMFGLVRNLLLLARGHFWFVPGMAVLALLASIFEGISLALIIPLVQLLDTGSGPAAGAGSLAFLNDLVELIPVESTLVGIVIAIIAAVVIKSAINYANMTVLGIVYGRVSHTLRTKVFSKIIDTPLPDFERDRSGRLLNILNVETWRATDALRFLFTIMMSGATVVVLSCILFYLSWRLSFVALGCIALIAPIAQVIGARAKALSKQGLTENEVLAKRTWTALNGMRMIHAFGCEESEIERFRKSSDRVRGLFLRMAMHTMTTAPVAEIVITVVIAMLFLFVQAGGMSLGAFAGFLAILYRLQPRILSLASAHTNLLGLHASVLAVSEVLQIPPDGMAQTGRPFAGLRKGLSFENVTFTYKGSADPALFDVSFRIPKGSVVAIVGTSGAGKSTLIDLLLRFQQPQQGRIVIDDTALNELNVASWRARLGVVNQDTYVFDDTVATNLAYGSPNATEAEIVEAARLACADEFIRALPDGYDTIVGERGTQLSGGQRQRLALARALIRHPDILILDEATNALDATTERAFQLALSAYSKQRTVIIVAHRLVTIESADHVIVLERGRVVEQGTPAALLKAGRAFARNFGPQSAAALEHTVAAKASAS